MTPCISSENYQLICEIRDDAIAYCKYFEKTKGDASIFAMELKEKMTACFEKLLYNEFYVASLCGDKPNGFADNLKIAQDILDGKYVEDRLTSVIKRLYVDI